MIYKTIIYESKEANIVNVKQVLVDINTLCTYFTPWVAQRELITDHVTKLADSIKNNPGVMPVFAAIIDRNGHRKLMDGLQRQAALYGLKYVNPDFEKEIRIDIYHVENHLDEECYDLFERLNTNLKVRKQDLPNRICGEVFKYIVMLYPRIFCNEDKTKSNRPMIIPNEFRKEVERYYILNECSLTAD
jgi:hypothetical protein